MINKNESLPSDLFPEPEYFASVRDFCANKEQRYKEIFKELEVYDKSQSAFFKAGGYG